MSPLFPILGMGELERSHTLVVLLKRITAISTAEVKLLFSVIPYYCHWFIPPVRIAILLGNFLLLYSQVKLGRDTASFGIGGDAVEAASVNSDFIFLVTS